MRIRNVASKTYLSAFRFPDGNGGIQAKSVSQPDDFQWFFITTGSGQFGGRYAIFSVMNDQDVFAKDVQILKADFEALNLRDVSDSKPEDSWFVFAPSSDATQFRIYYPTFQAAATVDPAVESIILLDRSGSITDSQWFVFEYEDMVFDHIEYHLDAGQLVGSAPTDLASQTAVNNLTTGLAQSMSVTLSAEVSSETSYTLQVGASITASVEATGGVPEVASEKIGLSTTVQTNITWGQTTTTTRTASGTATINVLPGQSFKCTLSGKQGTLSVPFLAIYRTKTSGQTMSLPGVYNGVSVYDVEAVWSQLN